MTKDLKRRKENEMMLMMIYPIQMYD